MKYIPANKLKAEIEKRQEELSDHNLHSIADEYDKVFDIIDSLQQEQVSTHGWIARDKDYNLSFYTYPPVRLMTSNEWSLPFECHNNDIESILPNNWFSNLRWEDEPIEVELSIRKI